MPNKLSFKPLARHPLISNLNPYLILIPLHLLYPPLTKTSHSITVAHYTHMLGHSLKYGGITLSPMVLHQRERLGCAAIQDRI